MANCQSDELIEAVGKKCVGAYQEAASPLNDKGCETRVEFTWVACIQDQQAHPESARRDLQFSRLSLGNNGVSGIDEKGDRSGRGHQFVKQFKAFGVHRGIEVVYARDIAAGPVEAGDEARLNRVCTR